jgi:hypothetical protein
LVLVLSPLTIQYSILANELEQLQAMNIWKEMFAQFPDKEEDEMF